MVIDLSNGSSANGTTVQAFSDNGSAAQIWDVRENQDGIYEISSVLNGKVLDVVNGDACDGAPIQLWQRNGSAAQRWKIRYNGGKFSIESALASGLYLNAGAQGERLTLIADVSSGSMDFRFSTASYTSPILTTIGWIGCGPTGHYSQGRQGNDWSKIVIHTSKCTTLEAIENTFWGSREASAHYGVDDTRIHQYVGLGDTAWAVGNWFWNLRNVSIEHVGTTSRPPSYITLDRSARLMAALARTKGWRYLKMDDNVGIHRQFSSTACPGPLDCNWLIAKANEYLGNGFTSNPVTVKLQKDGAV